MATRGTYVRPLSIGTSIIGPQSQLSSRIEIERARDIYIVESFNHKVIPDNAGGALRLKYDTCYIEIPNAISLKSLGGGHANPSTRKRTKNRTFLF